MEQTCLIHNIQCQASWFSEKGEKRNRVVQLYDLAGSKTKTPSTPMPPPPKKKSPLNLCWDFNTQKKVLTMWLFHNLPLSKENPLYHFYSNQHTNRKTNKLTDKSHISVTDALSLQFVIWIFLFFSFFTLILQYCVLLWASANIHSCHVNFFTQQQQLSERVFVTRPKLSS